LIIDETPGLRPCTGCFHGTAQGSVATPPVPAQCVRRPGRGGRIVDSTPSLRPWASPCVQHSRRAAVSITRSTALPACGREHHSIVDSTTGLPAVSFRSSTALPACRPITGLYIPLFSPLSFRTRLN